MKIKELFARDIYRPINGVVKADQLDESSVWQELDEYVVTKELTRHVTDLVDVLLSTIDSAADAAGKNGVWISGFFGSGKSHFIKVLSYLLENAEHSHRGESRKAIEFFETKLDNAMLFGDLGRVVAAPTDTILFNIDSKADHRVGRDTLLQVFLKVLNEKQGYSGDHPHIAHMERHLEENNRLAAFHAAFEKEAGESWHEARDAWEFHRDSLVKALGEALGQSDESVEKWVDSGGDNFSLTIENFSKWVKRYLDSRGPDQRLMFLVDEVGQFIGSDTHLMLSLQTITEQLGTVCGGRAWVVVTSQEDLDAVLGDLTKVKHHDFSKIQGRFKTRLSLSSANVDEVIKERLLRKNEAAGAPLAKAYDGKQDILRNQLSFTKAGMTFKTYADVEDFSECYPFAAYQFTLVQKVFESIRKAGATGLHLAQGERSTLDAFQNAAKQVGENDIGTLVPFYRFYPAVEGFLDTAVKRTIDQASDNHALQGFDSTVLQVLFLIRYIEELPGTVDNLVTLCVDEIDTDKLELRHTIEESLARLESETLVARNGDLYFFLTNEERDIGREIKSTSISAGEEERALGRMIFEDILGDIRKHTYSVTKSEFAFTRLCDDQVMGNRLEGSLEVSYVTPLGDSYAELQDDGQCILRSSSDGGRVLVRLPDESSLGRELRTWLQTESYVRTKINNTMPETTKRILRDRSDDNRARRLRIIDSLKTLLSQADYFTSGNKLDGKRSDPKASLEDALEYLIKNAYPKMGYIRHLHPNPKQEIQSTLRADDIEQVTLSLDTVEANAEALADLREYLTLCARSNKQVVLNELIDKRYRNRPYGWPELEVVLLVARLAVLREINLLADKGPLALDQAYDYLTTSTKQRKVVITQRESATGDLLKKAQALGMKLFAVQAGSGEEALFTSLKERLSKWDKDLTEYATLARTGKYPGLRDAEDCRGKLRKFVEEGESLRFLNRFVENEPELLEVAEDVTELQSFYNDQRHTWEQLGEAVREFEQNRLQLEVDDQARPAFARMKEILATERPYGLLHEVAGLIHTVRQVNDELVKAARELAAKAIQSEIDGVEAELGKVSAQAQLRAEATGELTGLLSRVKDLTSIAHITQAKEAAEKAFDRALSTIEAAQTPAPPAADGAGESPQPTPAAQKIKRRRIVEARTLWSAPFIETKADVEEFLNSLRAELEAAVEADERVQLK